MDFEFVYFDLLEVVGQPIDYQKFQEVRFFLASKGS